MDFNLIIYEPCPKCDAPLNPYHQKNGCCQEEEKEENKFTCTSCSGSGSGSMSVDLTGRMKCDDCGAIVNPKKVFQTVKCGLCYEEFLDYELISVGDLERFEGVDVICENCFAKKPNCSNCKNPSVVYWRGVGLEFCEECARKALL